MSATFPVQVDTASGAAVTTLAGASLTPVSGALYLVAVANFKAAVGTPTLTGTGGFAVTWTQEDTQADAGNAQRLTVFRGVAASATPGVLTADFGGVSQDQARMVTLRCPTVDQASSQGAVQSPKNTQAASSAPTVTFAAYGAVFNVAVMFALTNQNTTWAISTASWTAYPVIAGAGGSLGAMCRNYATLDVSPVGTFGASGVCCTVGVELKADATAAGPGNAVSAAPPNMDAASYLPGGGGIRGVQVIGERDFLFGAGGPGNYPVGDPAGLSALTMQESAVSDAPGMGIGVGKPFGKWIHKVQRDDVTGYPAAPSQRQFQYGLLKNLPIILSGATSHTISFFCKMEEDPGDGLRPQVIVKADYDMGIHADAVATAAAGTDWQVVSVTFTTRASSNGVVEVQRFKRDTLRSVVWWDYMGVV